MNPEPEMYCKATIRRIVEQMRVESEHWSQMQDVLRSLQEEMSTLSREREHWETRALRAEAELLSLHETVTNSVHTTTIAKPSIFNLYMYANQCVCMSMYVCM